MPKIVAILALPGVQLLDVSGPLDVFAQANIEAGRSVYDLRVIACRAGPIRSSSGVRLLPDAVAGKEPAGRVQERIDTLLVAGAPDAATTQLAPRVLDWLRTTAARAQRFGSVCTGAFALAASGLLERRRLTTHWASVETLARVCPTVSIEADSLYVRDGKLRTAAGVTAGLDLALALVEEDLGREIAMQVASQLVMFFKRPGGQMQFSRKGETRPAGRSALQEVQRWVAANPALAHRVPDLAQRVGLSPRHFARLFQAEVGLTPAAWVEAVRVDAARAILEAEAEAPKRVAARCGFANADTLRRAFIKHVGVSPAEYRRRFGGAAQTPA
ncbi:AraC family transcriptional regulator with amidase-like domain [Paraburkholderia eburnea]|uniref:AraC family transcriptional regulator with amidase-like domain n=1 Tax=Paraburkholderia eburnea TaxID=1189126 RepID=A0A2S4M652_9BURK|nr:GlxA family transcriptional regulator [Paraburkholderia eburnea]POR50188.1 AraC family transcriptional regulator with amidase-like domain [Paraburkholderia eburnea]PRZ20531.1 AraC family transcriptional regulator with amidase-like domain [Paraburkholderia eburnea]